MEDVEQDEHEKCFYNPEEELFAPFAEEIWYSENKPTDCSQPNSMDKQVISEQFAIYAIPKHKFPALCTGLHKAIGQQVFTK